MKKRQILITMAFNMFLILFGATLFFMSNQMPFFSERPTLYTILGLVLAGASSYDLFKNIKKLRRLSMDP